MELEAFVDRVIARLMSTPVDLSLLPEGGATGSLLNGAAGVAFFLHEVARLRGGDDTHARARQWCDAAKAWAARADASQWNDMPYGFVMGEGGLAYVDALLCAREENREGIVAAVAWIERASTRLGETTSPTARPTEYLGGAAGIVCLTLDLDARLPAGPDHASTRAALQRVRDRALEVVLSRYAVPLAPGPRDPLGFAHGIAGELWALAIAIGAEHPTVRARLAELASLRETDEEGLVYWLPAPASDATFLLGTWCNGMTGHALLWCEVARQTGSVAWMELARQCAESVAVLGSGGPSLCCGNAGQALALRRYADLSGDAAWRRQADDRLRLAAEGTEEPGGSAFVGLWQGTLGVALAAMGTLHGERAVPLQEPHARGGAS